MDIKPHRSRYWLNPGIDDWELFSSKVNKICNLYRNSIDLHKKGTHVISIDEKTGIQALEHKYPAKPCRIGHSEKIEFEYIRHGTTCLIGSFEVATGKLVSYTLNETRTEFDFCNHIEKLIDTDPQNSWIFIADGLNTHYSESLVKLVAKKCNITCDLGVKGKYGILKSTKSRKSFLEDEDHRIRFVYTPKHTSWLNQIEIWFGILSRKLINKRSSFKSVDDLKIKIIKFIEYYNENSNPFKWTYKGVALVK